MVQFIQQLGVEAGVTLAVMFCMIMLLIFTTIRPWVLFLFANLLVYLVGITTLSQTLSGYISSSLVLLLLLLLVSIPLERTSTMRKITARLITDKPTASIWRLGFFTGALSAFINNTAVVAVLMGTIKRQSRVAPSKLLLPLSYNSILGGVTTLIGTSTNLIVNGFVEQAGYESLGFFSFALLGVPVFLVSLAVMVLVSSRCLPEQSVESSTQTHDYFIERQLMAESPMVGRSVQENGLRRLGRIYLVEIIREHQVLGPVAPNEVLLEGDILVFTGDISALDVLESFPGLEPLDVFDETVRTNLMEVVVQPSSTLVGQRIRDVNFRARYNAAVVAARRGNQRLYGGLGALILQAGDSLVLATGTDFLRKNAARIDFINVGGLEDNSVLRPVDERLLLFGFTAVVVAGALDIFPMIKGLILLLTLMMWRGMIRLTELRDRFPYDLLIVVGSALGLARAMDTSGVTEALQGVSAMTMTDVGVFQAIIAVFFLTWLLTELMTNNAAAAIVFPVAAALSSLWPEHFEAFAMTVALGASASFLSPFGYQTNLMVYTAGQYSLRDYLINGFPVFVSYSATALFMIHWVYF